jgi:predicted transcriptional regulator
MDKNNQHFTNNLKTILEREGVRQIDFSKAVDIAYGTINKICLCKMNPSPTTKNKIVKGLNEYIMKEFLLEDVFPEK